MRFLLAMTSLLLLAACASDSASPDQPERLTITTPGLAQGIVGAPYIAQLAATGGDAPYTWGAVGLPAGLSIDAAGTITGVPTAAGSAMVEFAVTDSGPFTITRNLTLDIALPPALALAGNPPAAFTGMSYSCILAATGGVQPYTFTVAAGALPTGLTLDPSTGEISGVASAAGDWPFTARVTDLPGSQAQLVCSIRVHEGVSVMGPANLPVAYDGQPYYARVDASGGLPPYQWALTGAPSWLTVATIGDGWLELTSSAAGTGTVSMNAQVPDAAGGVAATVLSLGVQSAPTSTSGPSLVVTTGLPRARVGEYFDQVLKASGGIPVYWWSITGNLPEGLYIDTGAVSATARLRGRPRLAGVFTFHVNAVGTLYAGTGQDIELVVECAIGAIPDATAGTGYDAQPAVDDGGAGLTATLDSATPHNGLDFGAVSANGTPAAQGRTAANIRFSGGGKEFSQLVGFDVRPQPATLAVVTSLLPDGRRGSGYAYSARLMAEGGSGQGFGWSVIWGSLPPGLSLVGDTIAGGATSDGTFGFTVRVTDSASNTATQALAITIELPVKGDFNGDGRADFVFSSYFYQSTSPGVCLYYAEPAQAHFGTIGTDDADFHVIGRTTGVQFGDLNGDGVADLVTACAGANGAFATGTVKIFYGNAQSPRFGVGTPDCTISNSVAGDEFGSAIAVGDMDADGFDDIAIGSRGASTSVAQGGAVYIYYGGALQGQLDKSNADAQLTGQTAGAFNTYWGYYSAGYLGDSLMLRDLNADGRADLIAGATAEVSIRYSTAARLTGTGPMYAVADAFLTGLIGSHLAERLAVGDYNDDGACDIAVGGKDSYVYYGAAGTTPFQSDVHSGNAVLFSTPNLQGHSLYVGVCTIDLNHDGVDDLVFNTPEQGLAYAFFGSGTNPWWVAMDWAAADVSYGFSLNAYAAWSATRCDFNGDGADDLALGALNLSTSTPNGQLYTAGAVMILYGNPVSPPSGSVSPISTASVRFLGSVQNSGWGGCAAGG